MSEAAPPVVPDGGTPPVVPAAPPAPPVAATVTLSKEEHDRLVGRATGNQRKADLYDKTIGKKGGHFGAPPAPATPPSDEERAAAASAEDRKAERGLLALAADPALREVLDADPTLRNLLTSNPLAVLPMLASDALDADDAVTLVREALIKRKPVATPPATPPSTPATPPLGGVNPQDKPVNEEVEISRKNPNTERAVAGMIGARLKGMKK